jgi:hypothetical protein
MSVTAKIITPPSESDSNLESYEYFLAWYARTGELLQRLFLDRNIAVQVKTQPVNLRDSANIGNLVVDEKEEIVLVAEDLTKNDLETMRSILVSKNVFRVFKDGTSEKVAVNSKNIAYKNSAQRFNFEFSIVRRQNNLPR